MWEIKNKLFFHLLGNTFLCSVANNFMWFALSFWAYLETKSIMVTSFIGWMYLFSVLVSWVFFWALVDHNKKKNVMLLSTLISFFFFVVAGFIYAFAPEWVFQNFSSWYLWIFVVVILLWVIVGNIRMIAMSTMMTLLFSDETRDKANWMLGVANGIAFWIVSVLSWLVIGFLWMWWAIMFTLIASFLCIVHLTFLHFPKEDFSHHHEEWKKIDIKGTIKIIWSISWLFGLIFFTMFNNFLWGAFVALMDPYGLSLVSVEVWGIIWWSLSFGFIVWWLLISKWGLGKNPLKTLLLVNIILWIVCIFFTSVSSIIVTTIGLFFFMVLNPYAEASEQTILQKIVPFNRQWRVFWFAQSIEQTASPITAFLIGPITELFVIPFMASEKWEYVFWWWFGTTDDRGIALVFSMIWMVGLVITLLAFLSKSYKNLSKVYLEEKNNI